MAAHDIALMFRPGMQKNRAWPEDGSLARIISSGVPLVASAYEEVECEMDQWEVEAYGYAAAGKAALNPFFLDLSDERTRIQWARAVTIRSAGSCRRLLPGQQSFCRARSPHEHGDAQHAGKRRASFEPGARIEFQTSAGTWHSLIHVFDGYCADPATGELLQLTSAGEIRSCGLLSREEILSYPARSAHDLDHALWAARIKAEKILLRGASDNLDEFAAARASSMFSALRGRARNLFRS